MKLTISREMPLGNGTRPRGFLLADIECEDLAELHSAALAHDCQVETLPATVHAAEGVEPSEVLTALRNPGLCEWDADAQPTAVVEKPQPSRRSWRDTPLAELKLEKHVRAALKTAGLTTAGAIHDYGQANQGLAGLKGIGEKTEQQVIAALQAVMPAGELE